MKAVIMAGGKGIRLKSIISDIPKPMFSIKDKPILEYQIETLRKSGITDITLIVGHLWEVIKDYFGDGSKWNVNISYIIEDIPLGTAGALFHLKDLVTDDFFLVFGDLIIDIDWNRFMNFHKEKGGLITLFGHPNSHPYDSDVIDMDDKGKVLGIYCKNNARNYYYHNFVNSGLYVVSPKLLNYILHLQKMDLEKDVIIGEITKGTVYSYKSTEYVKDMGTPNRYESVIRDVDNGVVNSRNLKNKQKCIFLDRDGTINNMNGLINHRDKFEVMKGVDSAIKRINQSDFLCVVITNQPVISRGECNFEEIGEIHKKLETQLGEKGCYIDDIFFCPHHPHKGYKGEVPELKFECGCRKPKTGMIDEAVKKYNIDLKSSWFVGDTTIDIQTGINAGVKTILVQTGEKGMDGKYNVTSDYICKDLNEAIDVILSA